MASFEKILARKDVPVIAIDQGAVIFHVNTAFRKEYGWKKKELMGNRIVTIIPEHMRDAHLIGFSRFVATEQPAILNKHLALPILCADGTIRQAVHLITGKKTPQGWRFAAEIRPNDG